MEKREIHPDPHHGQPILTAGGPLEHARAAMVMVHGRGARAEDILTLVSPLAQPGFAYLAPQAAGNAWYPNRFTAPLADNEPWLSSALAFVERAIGEINRAGIPTERTILLGFSQGACLALEYAVRHPRRYGGVVGLSGALIGPEGVGRDLSHSLAGTPVFLGSSDVDPFVPKERIMMSGETFKQMGGEVSVRFYPNLAHTTTEDEILFVRQLMQVLIKD